MFDLLTKGNRGFPCTRLYGFCTWQRSQCLQYGLDSCLELLYTQLNCRAQLLFQVSVMLKDSHCTPVPVSLETFNINKFGPCTLVTVSRFVCLRRRGQFSHCSWWKNQALLAANIYKLGRPIISLLVLRRVFILGKCRWGSLSARSKWPLQCIFCNMLWFVQRKHLLSHSE